jgi:hypothetical protein
MVATADLSENMTNNSHVCLAFRRFQALPNGMAQGQQ